MNRCVAIVILLGLFVFGPRSLPAAYAAAQTNKSGSLPSAPLSLVPELIRESLLLVEQITDAGAKASALSSIAVARARAGNMPGAKQSFAAAKQSAQSITDDGALADALKNIAAAQAQAGDKAGARQTFDAARQAAEPITDAFGKAVALQSIASAQAKSGDVAAARLTAEQVTDGDFKATALSDIAVAQAQAGDTAGARQTVGQIDKVWWKINALSRVVQAIVKATKTAQAEGASEAQQPENSEVPNAPVLTPEIRQQVAAVLRRIQSGAAAHPYARDGTVFRNREQRLPLRPQGYYREYTVPTPGASDRGERRVVTGRNGEVYVTLDHYESFLRFRP